MAANVPLASPVHSVPAARRGLFRGADTKSRSGSELYGWADQNGWADQIASTGATALVPWAAAPGVHHEALNLSGGEPGESRLKFDSGCELDSGGFIT